MFVKTQFSYCPLVWILHSRTLNNKINRLHERPLKTGYFDYTPSYNILFEEVGFFQSIVEVFKL